MGRTRLTPLILIISLTEAPARSLAADPEFAEFRLLFLLFFAGFTAIMLFASLPRRVRADYVPAALLRTFAASKGLVAMPRTEAEAEAVREDRRSRFRRWFSANPASARPAPGSTVFRGNLEGYPVTLDEAWGGRRAANAWQGQPYLRLSVQLASAPRSLELRPASLFELLTGRAGLRRHPSGRRDRGMLIARFSTRPLDRAKERMFLTDERRRMLEDYEAAKGGVHLYDGRLFLIRQRFDVNVRELDELYEDLGSLASRLERSG